MSCLPADEHSPHQELEWGAVRPGAAETGPVHGEAVRSGESSLTPPPTGAQHGTHFYDTFDSFVSNHFSPG